jgi:hypothetical protein
MDTRDPDLIAKNECIGALFPNVTGRDPYFNDCVRSALEEAISDETNSPVPLEIFMRRAFELSMNRGGCTGFSMCIVNLRARVFEPLWLRSELMSNFKRVTGYKSALVVVSGLRGAVERSIPRRGRRAGFDAAMSEARHLIDSLAARFSAGRSRLSVLYID